MVSLVFACSADAGRSLLCDGMSHVNKRLNDRVIDNFIQKRRYEELCVSGQFGFRALQRRYVSDLELGAL